MSSRLVRLFTRPIASSTVRLLRLRRTLLTLAIETSCDDCAVAILSKNGPRATLHFNERISANNAQFRGIHPIVALETHEENVAALVKKALASLPNGQTPELICATRGPGMRQNLAAGINTAKGLAVAWNVPFVGVHHMQAHALAARLAHGLKHHASSTEPAFPFYSLLLSGGHSLLVRSTAVEKHEIVVDSCDIAIGDALDKAARVILPEDVLAKGEGNISYGQLLEEYAFPPVMRSSSKAEPAGTLDLISGNQGSKLQFPKISPSRYSYLPPHNIAQEITALPTQYGWSLPHSLAGTKRQEFTFSALESQVTQIATHTYNADGQRSAGGGKVREMGDEERRFLAREVLRVTFEHVASRIRVVLDAEAEGIRLKQFSRGRDTTESSSKVPSTKTLVLGGGVASNKFLQHVLGEYLSARGHKLNVLAAPGWLCTDNAAMIGWCGLEMYEAGFRTGLDVRAVPVWSLANLMTPEKETSGMRWVEKNPSKVLFPDKISSII
jgi:N6-L-threonylcarbamoyladenine synthase